MRFCSHFCGSFFCSFVLFYYLFMHFFTVFVHIVTVHIVDRYTGVKVDWNIGVVQLLVFS